MVQYITYLRTKGKKWDLGFLITKLHFLLNEVKALGIRERKKENPIRQKKPRVWTCLHHSLNSKGISDHMQDNFF